MNKDNFIFEQEWAENIIHLISIGCVTYNHELYIRDAIVGFLMRKTIALLSSMYLSIILLLFFFIITTYTLFDV